MPPFGFGALSVIRFDSRQFVQPAPVPLVAERDEFIGDIAMPGKLRGDPRFVRSPGTNAAGGNRPQPTQGAFRAGTGRLGHFVKLREIRAFPQEWHTVHQLVLNPIGVGDQRLICDDLKSGVRRQVCGDLISFSPVAQAEIPVPIRKSPARADRGIPGVSQQTDHDEIGVHGKQGARAQNIERVLGTINLVIARDPFIDTPLVITTAVDGEAVHHQLHHPGGATAV